MFSSKEKGKRNYVAISPVFHRQRHRNIWYTIGAAIIFITIVAAISLGIWSLII